jgi:hypothetical protein
VTLTRRATGGAMPGAMEPAEADAAAAAAAGRRLTASERRRMYRDLALSLRCGLRDAAAGFSFLRLRGLRALLRALRSTSDADADAGLFRDSQSIRDLQGSHPRRVHLSSSTRLCPLPSSRLIARANQRSWVLQ